LAALLDATVRHTAACLTWDTSLTWRFCLLSHLCPRHSSKHGRNKLMLSNVCHTHGFLRLCALRARRARFARAYAHAPHCTTHAHASLPRSRARAHCAARLRTTLRTHHAHAWQHSIIIWVFIINIKNAELTLVKRFSGALHFALPARETPVRADIANTQRALIFSCITLASVIFGFKTIKICASRGWLFNTNNQAWLITAWFPTKKTPAATWAK